jgi:hypothetical protein
MGCQNTKVVLKWPEWNLPFHATGQPIRQKPLSKANQDFSVYDDTFIQMDKLFLVSRSVKK